MSKKKYSDHELIQRFAEVIQEHPVKDSTAYDALKVEKPPRTTLRERFGSWKVVLNKANQYINSGGAEDDANYTSTEAGVSAAPSEQEPGEHPEVRLLRQQVADLTRHIQTPQLYLDGVVQTFGIVSDTHFGSVYSDHALLEFAYDVFEAAGAKTVLHSGDLLDGEKMYKGHEYEVSCAGADAQIDLCIDGYPKRDGVTTYFIDGNHDRSFWKRSGVNTGSKIAARREDMVYLGYMESDIVIGEGDCKATVRLFHGEDGSGSYAISYRPQRYVSELPSGTKPDILIMGHYHKAEQLFYRGVTTFQAGTTQRQTPFMRGRRLAAAIGFWLIKVTVGPHRIVKVRSEFYPVRS
jgi:UDP-2,3-diacylglucosamine pyrophosphatase LpxH